MLIGVYLVSGIGYLTFVFAMGLIDEVRIYDRVLSPGEIKAIYEREAPPLSVSQGLVPVSEAKTN